MSADPTDSYLDGLPADQRAELARVNEPGLAALREYLASGEAVAFLGAGASRPLYPLWDGLIAELVDAAAPWLTKPEAATCRALAQESPEEVVEFVRARLGPGGYREVLRQVLQTRTDPVTGRSWTPVQELVCRCAFRAVMTTNYDPGIVDARMRVRPSASATGFTTWEDELGLDRWRTGDVFGEDELPVLFAHGQHNKPDSVVLAATEYRRAYAGKLPQVLARLVDTGHLMWLGFSFADQRIAAVLREVADRTGTRIDPGGAPRHVAVMAWDPDAKGNDPGVLARRAEISYGALLVLYPAPHGDHSALGLLLAEFTDHRFPLVSSLPIRTDTPTAATEAETAAADAGLPVEWVPAAEPAEHFTGRTEELARLDRWADDPEVALVGVSAWGGAGKTALVTHWVNETDGPGRRPGVRGVFGWSFYADPSAEHWAEALLDWARKDLGIKVPGAGRLAVAVLRLMRNVPLVLVLDGLEVVQEGPAGDGFGRLLDGTLREVLAGACQQPQGGLVVLTSRFPFADLEIFDGGSARMLEVPPFTVSEGSALLAAAGAGWLDEEQRRDLVAAVDGHALATGVLAGLLAARPPVSDLIALRAELAEATRTDVRVSKVLQFYAKRLAEVDRYLLAAVSLFARPTGASAVLAVARHPVFGTRLAGWTPARVREAVRTQLAGLASWHPNGTISAHPLVRDTFRPLALGAAETAAQTALVGIPAGIVASRADALRVVETIELLLDVGHWRPADDMYQARSGNSHVWKHLPAARLGQRATGAFVATADRRAACATHLGPDGLNFYLNEAGMFAMAAGDLAVASGYLREAVRQSRDTGETLRLAVRLQNLAHCLGYLGQIRPAGDAATESLDCAQATGNQGQIRDSHARAGWLAGLAGHAIEADEHFAAADKIQIANDRDHVHLYSAQGTEWAEWLARTERRAPAEALTRINADICRLNGWKEHMARCDRVIGRLALANGDTSTAGNHLDAAAGCFREGDYLSDLAETLADLAEHARVVGDLDSADRYATEAIGLAAPRSLVPAHSVSLAVRARIRAAQAATNPALLGQGRDASDAALRLAVRHHLPWHEVGALRAHAALDQAEGVDHGWAVRANTLHSQLVPRDLDRDPPTTVKQLVAGRDQKRTERKNR